jgi:hypothetical protein
MLVNITVNRTSNPVNITTRGLHDGMLPVRGLPKAHRYVGRAAHDVGQADPLSIVFSMMTERGPIEAREEAQVEVPIQIMRTFYVVLVTDAP